MLHLLHLIADSRVKIISRKAVRPAHPPLVFLTELPESLLIQDNSVIFQVEIIVSGNGIGNLTPGCNNGFLSLLTTGGKKQQSSEKMDIYANSVQFSLILRAKVIIFLQI